MEYKINNLRGIRLIMGLVFNDELDFGKDYVQNEIMGIDDIFKTHSDYVISLMLAADNNDLTRRYLIDKRYNIEKKLEFSSGLTEQTNLAIFTAELEPTDSKFHDDSCIIECMDECSSDIELSPIFDVLLDDLIRTYKKKLSKSKIQAIKESLLGLTIHVGSTIISNLKFGINDNYNTKDNENVIPIMYDSILVNPREDNVELMRFNKGLQILRELFPDNVKLSRLINESIEQLLPYCLNSTSKEEDEYIKDPLKDNKVILDLSVFTEDFSTVVHVKGLISEDYKASYEEFLNLKDSDIN